jgi:hypothetical protein
MSFAWNRAMSLDMSPWAKWLKPVSGERQVERRGPRRHSLYDKLRRVRPMQAGLLFRLREDEPEWRGIR